MWTYEREVITCIAGLEELGPLVCDRHNDGWFLAEHEQVVDANGTPIATLAFTRPLWVEPIAV